MKTKNLGKFGEFVKEYESARRLYPSEIFTFLKSLLKVKKPQILDIGCGTGISTRQLVKIGTVIGCDPDAKMLKAARKHKSAVKKYVFGSADKLPFANQTFEVVTAFSALHWFDNKTSATEIKRVLKPGGVFFIASRMGVKSWGEGYRSAIMKTIHQPVANFKDKSYNPNKTLIENGFRKVTSRHWYKTELYSLGKALEYVQSVSIWNSVLKSSRLKAVEGLKDYFKNMEKSRGKIERKLTVKAVAGIK